MNKLILLTLATTILAGCESTPAPEPTPQPEISQHQPDPADAGALPRAAPTFPHQEHTVEDGRALALAQGRPLAVIFQKPGCYTCEMFARRHLNEPDVFAALSQCVVVRKYYTQEERDRFHVDAVPLVLVWQHRDGELRFAEVMKGMLGADILAKRVRDVVAGRNRCEETLDAAVAGDQDARFLVDHYYAGYLTAEQLARLPR